MPWRFMYQTNATGKRMIVMATASNTMNCHSITFTPFQPVSDVGRIRAARLWHIHSLRPFDCGFGVVARGPAPAGLTKGGVDPSQVEIPYEGHGHQNDRYHDHQSYDELPFHFSPSSASSALPLDRFVTRCSYAVALAPLRAFRASVTAAKRPARLRYQTKAPGRRIIGVATAIATTISHSILFPPSLGRGPFSFPPQE